jgi:hypothetical protein
MRLYVMVTAGLLLAIGVVGFAFMDQYHVPKHILLMNLILGIWGLWVLLQKRP